MRHSLLDLHTKVISCLLQVRRVAMNTEVVWEQNTSSDLLASNHYFIANRPVNSLRVTPTAINTLWGFTDLVSL